MLDEKKIEAIVDSNVSLVCDLVPDSPIVNYKDSLKNLMISCIKKGIELTFEGLWHDASEEPRNDYGLVITHSSIGVVYPIDMNYTMNNATENNYSKLWERIVIANRIDKWFYFNDILPKQKGGE